MAKFIIKRVAYGLITMFIIITATFFLIHAVPGDPMAQGAKHFPEAARAAFKEKYGLDKPVYVQYFVYLKGVLKGDLGDSIEHTGRSVNSIVKSHAPVSGIIGGRALIIELVVGVLFGIIAAFNRERLPDHVIMFFVILLICMPTFVSCSLLQYIFGVKLKWVPVVGWGKPKNAILPVIAMALGGIATYTKFTRNSILNVISQDYIITAKAKGLSTGRLTRKHVLRNAMIPIVTLIGPAILGIFNGSFIIESIFAIPGLGQYFVEAVNTKDYSVMMGLTIFTSCLYVLSLILVDILYAIVDPRIRITESDQSR